MKQIGIWNWFKNLFILFFNSTGDMLDTLSLSHRMHSSSSFSFSSVRSLILCKENLKILATAALTTTTAAEQQQKMRWQDADNLRAAPVFTIFFSSFLLSSQSLYECHENEKCWLWWLLRVEGSRSSLLRVCLVRFVVLSLLLANLECNSIQHCWTFLCLLTV